MTFNILLIGGVKGYTKYHAHIINILSNFNSCINDTNTIFTTLQPLHEAESSDLYISDQMNYIITPQHTVDWAYLESSEAKEFDKSLNSSFDFIVSEHCPFFDSVEVLKYNNLLRVNGYFMTYYNK